MAQNIIVDDTYTAQQLIENVLINGPCANVANFNVYGGNFGTGENSYGYFNANGSSFPFSEGIVLSTCRADKTPGPNNVILSDSATGWTGDSDLQQALGISNTYDATILEFDFTPLTNKISFDYIFASEEYHGNSPCNYSDGFAFLLKEASGTTYQNLALVPNTATPVKVTTVHPAIPGACLAINEAYFGSYNNTSAPINFNGQTVVMTAKADVIPGTTYHIKLVIADETNPQYDSAIFLGAGSFNVGTDIGPDRLVATGNPLCNGENYILDATEPGTNTYKWFKDNAEILGETNPTYTVTSPGDYRVEITLNSTACVAKGEVTIEYVGILSTSPVTLAQCDDDGDGLTTYDLTKLTSVIQGSSQGNTIAYYLNQYDADHSQNAITNPTAFQNSSANQVLFAGITNSFGCTSSVQITLQIANNALPTVNPVTVCDNDGTADGLTGFDLNQTITPKVLNGLPAGLVVTYYATSANAYAQSNPLPNNFTNTTPNSQTIFARIVNGPDCYGIIPVKLQVTVFNTSNFQDEPIAICLGDSKLLSVPNNFSSYLWSTGETTSSIIVTSAANYSVTVTNSSGCQATKTFIVTASSAPIITAIDIRDLSDNSNSVQVNVSGIGDYEYSLDGINFQNTGFFNNVAPDAYTVTVRDQNGCNPIATKPIYVLDYPKYFTPNGDGVHDIWQIKNLLYYPKAYVTIFDRYGKAIFGFNSNQPGWNGKLNSRDLFADDYWFVITLGNGRIVKGHFALLR